MKLFSLFFLFLTWSASLSAQFNLGVKAGLNLNDVRVVNYPVGYTYPSEMNFGFHIGVYSQLKVTEKVYFIPEARFTQRGFNYILQSGDRNLITLSYIELPLLFTYQLNGVFALEIGPSVAFRTSSKRTFKGTTVDAESTYKRPVDAGINIGIRYNVTDRLLIIGRYYYGMKFIADFYYGANNSSLASYYNRSIEIGLGYRFEIKNSSTKKYNPLKRSLDPPKK